MKNKFYKIAIFIPFILGVIGYLCEYSDKYLDAMYFSLRLYGMNFDTGSSSVILELARWSAILVTTSIIFKVAKTFYKKLHIKAKLFFSKEMIVIYGDNLQSQILARDLKKNGLEFILSTEIIISKKTLTQVIMFENQEDNLKFFSKNIDNFTKNSEVHIWLEKLENHMISHENIDLYPFSTAEITAQLFWKSRHKQIEKLVECKEVVKMAVIGSGINIEKMLSYAVHLNLFNKNQKIEYHVFGNLENYINLHYKMQADEQEKYKKIHIYPNDSIFFYNDSWQKNAGLLMSMDEVIICDNRNDNLQILSEIKEFLPYTSKIHLQFKVDNIFQEKVMTKNKINIFGSFSEIFSYSEIIYSELIDAAKKQHEYYSEKYAKPNDDPEKVEANKWENLNNFKRDSNIFSTLFWSLKADKILKIKTEKELDYYAEIEHIRWARFHYMHNWVYSENKNEELREHNCLIDYNFLSASVKSNDQDSIKLAIKTEKKKFQKKINVNPKTH